MSMAKDCQHNIHLFSWPVGRSVMCFGDLWLRQFLTLSFLTLPFHYLMQAIAFIVITAWIQMLAHSSYIQLIFRRQKHNRNEVESLSWLYCRKWWIFTVHSISSSQHSSSNTLAVNGSQVQLCASDFVLKLHIHVGTRSKKKKKVSRYSCKKIKTLID